MKSFLPITSGLLLSLAAPAGAQTLVLDGFGELTGVTGLNVDGTFYDVNFLDGTCVDIFSGCDDASDFAFNSLNLATLAGQALIEQVFVINLNRDYDLEPYLTAGCENFLAQCFMAIPFATDGSLVTVLQALNDSTEQQDDGAHSSGQVSVTLDSSNLPSAVWARFTPAAAPPVPEPGTWAMMLIGFGGVGFVLRRRRPARQLPQLA